MHEAKDAGLARRSHRQHDARGDDDADGGCAGARVRRDGRRSSASASGPDTTSISTDVLAERGAEAVQLIADVAAAAASARSGAGARQGELLRNLAIQQEHAAGGRAGEVRRADLRRSSLRPAVPDRGDAQGLHARSGAGVPSRPLHAPAAPGSTSPACSTRRRWKRPSARRSTPGRAAPQRDAAESPAPADRRLRAARSRRTRRSRRSCSACGCPTRRTRTGSRSRSRTRSSAASFASRITVEHPRAEGLHLLAVQHASRPHPGEAHWVETADVTTNVTGRVAQGDLLRDRSAAEGSAAGRGAAAASRTTWPASSSCRTPRAAASSAGSRSSTCTGSATTISSTYVKRVMAVTPEDVRRIANDYLTPDKMTLVVVGDTKTVKEQVAPWSGR